MKTHITVSVISLPYSTEPFLSSFLSFSLPDRLTLLHFWQQGEPTVLVFILTCNASVLLGALVCSHILGHF